MIELCDLVDAAGMKLGRTVARGTCLPSGEYFPVVHLWIIDQSGAFLIQRRAEHLASAPGLWATTAGYVQAGESGREAVVRETREEMGLRVDAGALMVIGDCLSEHRRQEVWLLRTDRQELGAVTIGEDVSDWRWERPETIAAMIQDGSFFPYRYFHGLILADLPNIISANFRDDAQPGEGGSGLV